jgi:hypothetical protein
MSSEPLRIYVPIDDDAMLPQAEQRIRQETFAAMRDAGITAPDVETAAMPRVVIDQNEEASCEVRITLRMLPSAIRNRVKEKVMANLMLAGFDPHVVIEKSCEGWR